VFPFSSSNGEAFSKRPQGGLSMVELGTKCPLVAVKSEAFHNEVITMITFPGAAGQPGE
jgi:hypothetical protein